MKTLTLTEPFWRTNPFTPEEGNLVDLVLAAHARSAGRGNASTQVLLTAYAGSGQFTFALAAAMNTLGGRHGPIEETMIFLATPKKEQMVRDFLKLEMPIPGWGNSFHRGRPDPEWREVDQTLMRDFAQYWLQLAEVTDLLHKAGKQVYPNPSAYTAVTAWLLGMPRQLAPWLFVAGRLTAWGELVLAQQKMEQKKTKEAKANG